MRLLVLSGVLAVGALLAGCGHKDVKAPCSASEGYMSLAAAEDRCGPMRPVNVPDDGRSEVRPVR